MLRIYTLTKKLLLCFSLLTAMTAYAVEWQSYNMVVNKHKLHYYQSGSGKPIMLLSGYATTSNFWDKTFVNCLAQTNSVYLVDYWGINTGNDSAATGNSSIAAMAEDSLALADALHLSNPVVIGWSMGGAVAQQMSFTRANDLGKMILIAPVTINNQPVEGNEPKEVNLKTYADVLNYVFANNLYAYTPKELKFYKNSLFAPTEKLFPGNQVGANQRIAMNKWTSNSDTTDAMAGSSAEYLVMIPNQDKILDPVKTEEDVKRYQHAHVIKFENSGHNISMQAPDMVCAQIENFIK